MGPATRRSEWAGTAPGFRVGGLGDPGTWLLSGPQAEDGPESLPCHLARFGPPPAIAQPAALRTLVRESGLLGRGGGGFPVWRKLETARLSPGEPVVVVNASESEPASRKDRTLCSHRPHLVLDGAAAAAAVVGASEVVVHLHAGALEARRRVERAIGERRAVALGDPRWRLSVGPDRYVAGEASAIARLLEGGDPLPLFAALPMAVRGPSGRPTVVQNAETMAHLGLLLRIGPARWRLGGSPETPGSHLFTLAGSVRVPGLVVELVGRATVGDVLVRAGGTSPPSAVLVGGYAGTWVEGANAWRTPLDGAGLQRVGATPGCGLIGVLPHGACGLVETARLCAYLAAGSAGQCGPCVLGLPKLARWCEDLAAGRLTRRRLRHLMELAASIPGSGACSHPDGVVRMVRSALDVFEDDVVRHLAGRPCRGSDHRPVFPVPIVDAMPGWR